MPDMSTELEQPEDLASLYRRQASAERAKEVLEAGRARHPDDAELAKALESLKR